MPAKHKYISSFKTPVKFTAREVQQMRNMHARGIAKKVICDRFQCSISYLNGLLRNPHLRKDAS